MEIRKGVFELAKWPLTTAINIGGFVLEATGRSSNTLRLHQEEPLSRASIALYTATRAIRKSRPDQSLAQFEVLRAATAVNDISKQTPELLGEIGREVIEVAMELPDEEKCYEIVEEVTKTALENFAPPHPTGRDPFSE